MSVTLSVKQVEMLESWVASVAKEARSCLDGHETPIFDSDWACDLRGLMNDALGLLSRAHRQESVAGQAATPGLGDMRIMARSLLASLDQVAYPEAFDAERRAARLHLAEGRALFCEEVLNASECFCLGAHEYKEGIRTEQVSQLLEKIKTSDVRPDVLRNGEDADAEFDFEEDQLPIDAPVF